MSIVANYMAYKILRMLTTPWDKTSAFKAGLIDAKGKRLVPDEEMTRDQSSSYGLLEKLVFNLKRILENVPGGKSKFGAYAAAMWLISESNIDDPESQDEFYRLAEEMGLTPEGYITESTRRSFRMGDRVIAEGYVDTETFNFGTLKVEGIVTGRATASDAHGNTMYYVKSGTRTLAISGAVMEDAGAAPAGGGDGGSTDGGPYGGSSGDESRPSNNVGNIKGAPKKLGGMVRRKLKDSGK